MQNAGVKKLSAGAKKVRSRARGAWSFLTEIYPVRNPSAVLALARLGRSARRAALADGRSTDHPVIGVAMFKNEEAVARPVIERLLDQGVGRVIVADNGSTDATRSILDDLAKTRPVTVVDDPIVGYFQGAKMTRLARAARRAGAGWVVPFDADELWTGPDGTGLAAWLQQLPADVDSVDAAVINHLPTDHDPTDGDPFTRLVHHEPHLARLEKMAFRPKALSIIAAGNHSVRPRRKTVKGLVVRHYPLRSAAQLQSKARQGVVAMDAAVGVENGAAPWRSIATWDEAALAAEWADMLSRTDLVFDPAPTPAGGPEHTCACATEPTAEDIAVHADPEHDRQRNRLIW